jgi:adhesin/invasin
VSGEADVTTEGYSVTVEPVTDTMVATGADSLTVTATAESDSGAPLNDLPVTFDSSDPGQSFGAVTDHGDGTYSATLNGSTTSGTATISASASGTPTVTSTTVETEGYTVTVQPVPAKLVATGLDSVPVSATAESASGELLPGLDVSFGSSDAGQSFGAVTDEGDGTYSTILSGSTTVGSATVTAAVTGAGEPTLVGASVTTEGYSVTVSPIDEPILGTGAATLTVTALARSASRVPMPGLKVSFVRTDPGQSFGAVTDNEDGTYSAKLTGSTTPGISGIRAVVTGAGTPTTPEIELVTDRYDKPSIAAAISSSAPARNGWFRTPVTVAFACAGTLPLAAACPAPVVLGTDGRDQMVTRTVTDSLGSSASVTSAAVSIDATAPGVSVTGARNGATYKKPRKLVCKGTDALSGVASCKVTTTKKKSKKRTVVRWQATAVDRAGNTATSKGQYAVKKKVTKKPKRR